VREHEPVAVEMKHRHHRFVGMSIERGLNYHRAAGNRLKADSFLPAFCAFAVPLTGEFF
jgi:hypothetical protein